MAGAARGEKNAAQLVSHKQKNVVPQNNATHTSHSAKKAVQRHRKPPHGVFVFKPIK